MLFYTWDNLKETLAKLFYIFLAVLILTILTIMANYLKQQLAIHNSHLDNIF